MALCISAIVIGEWLSREDVMERYPSIIKVLSTSSQLIHRTDQYSLPLVTVSCSPRTKS